MFAYVSTKKPQISGENPVVCEVILLGKENTPTYCRGLVNLNGLERDHPCIVWLAYASQERFGHIADIQRESSFL